MQGEMEHAGEVQWLILCPDHRVTGKRDAGGRPVYGNQC